MNVYDALNERGFIYQVTDEQQVRDLLAEQPVTFYIGFDPTARSLHIGHLLPIMAMRWFQKHGHRALALVGGATAMVGDPAGRSEERPVLSRAEVDSNAAQIKEQLGRFIDFSEGRAEMVNNADWLASLNYIDFLREVGRCFSVNRMLQAESVKSRLETGLSFLEFNYMLLQAYDFEVLCGEKNCRLQVGGQDQWGNIVAGVELTRRKRGEEVYGITFPLLLKADGGKFGKTAEGTVWLDSELTSPYDYYQFWRNAADADVPKLLNYFTELPQEEVNRLGALQPPDVNRAKEILAYEATSLAHGHHEAAKAYLAAASEFGYADPEGTIETSSAISEVQSEKRSDDLPQVQIPAAELEEGVPAAELFQRAGLCSSKGEAKRLIKGGGAYINDQRVNNENEIVSSTAMENERLLLRAGKKKLVQVKSE